MQVTGIIEETSAAKAKEKAQKDDLTEEQRIGKRLLKGGREMLVGGVWGVIGLRRRILVRISALWLSPC
jgi:hypothetical protein